MSDHILDNSGDVDKPGERPTFLTVLCILTYIGSGLATLAFLFAVIAFSAMYDELAKVPGMKIFLQSGGVAIFLVMFALALTSLLGAVQMWRLKKAGFYMYVGANSCAFVLPLVILKTPFDPIAFGFLVLWIALYAANFKHLK